MSKTHFWRRAWFIKATHAGAVSCGEILESFRSASNEALDLICAQRSLAKLSAIL